MSCAATPSVEFWSWSSSVGTKEVVDTQPVVSLEGKLIERARAGDNRAFRSLYEQHAPRVFRFLCDLLSDRASAEEATQETFVRAHDKLATLRDQDRIGPWLFGIARFVAMETYKARKRRTDDDPELIEVDRAPTPEAALIGRQTGEALVRALAALPQDRRAALVLYTDHELGYGAIAEIMGWSLAKVKVEIFRARQTLRAALSGSKEQA